VQVRLAAPNLIMNILNLNTRIEITANGKMFMGFSVEKAPTNSEETLKLLKELVAVLESPDVQDFQTLGEQGKWVNPEC
jgi:hypothetical protein